MGLSDHSLDLEIAKAALAAGAEVFEKHIAFKGEEDSIINSLIGKDIKVFRDAIDETIF